MMACGRQSGGRNRMAEVEDGEEDLDNPRGVHSGEDVECQATTQGLYTGGGAKCSYHGMEYQFQLLMLFAIRALNLGYSNFSLATEMHEAHKIDDIVFSYGKVKNSTRRYFRFLQAKHANDQEKRKISATNLLDEGNGNMSLKKYFQSFRIVRRNLLGENDRIEDVIICTNMDFNYGSVSGGFKLREDIFEEVMTEGGEECEDDILKVVMVKFKKKFEGREEIVNFLKKNAIETPWDFAFSLVKRRRYVHKKCSGVDQLLYDEYERALVEEVIDPSSGTFRIGFIHGENLSSAATHFREVITRVYMKSYQGEERKNEETLRSFLSGEKVLSNWELLQPKCCILNPKKLGKKLAELVRRNRESKFIKVLDKDSLVSMNARTLNTCAWERDGSVFKFREEFLTGTLASENLNEVRICLIEQISHFKMDVEDLRCYSFHIDIPSVLAHFEISDISLEEELDSFLDKLVFAVKYPGVPSLEDMIMAELSKIFNPAHTLNVFSRFSKMLQLWLMEKEGRFLGRKDLEVFFDGLKAEMEGSIKFDLGDPVASFSGRKKELSRLRSMLLGDESEVGNRRTVRFVNILGPGGVGKSELAKKHAQDNLPHYKSVVWIDAGFREHLEESFLDLAFNTLGVSKVDAQGQVKDLDSVVGEVYDYFIGKTCLFVFDDVESESDLERFLPKTSRISNLAVIITSRNGKWAVAEKLDLGGLNTEESIEFLKNTIKYSSIFNADEAKKLAKALHYFPLAMQQAAYYIKGMSLALPRGQFGIPEYLNLFERKMMESGPIYVEDELENFYSNPKYITILITREFLQKLEHGIDVLRILNVIAYLSPGSVDVDFVSKVLRRGGQVALRSLKECSFISMSNSKLAVDRSVAFVTRTVLRNLDNEERILREAMETELPLRLGHLHTIWSNSVRYGELVKDFSHISMRIMDYISRKSLDQRAFAYGTNAIEIMSPYVQNDHYSVVSILYKVTSGIGQISMNGNVAELLRTRILFDIEYFWQNNNNDMDSLIRQGLVLILLRQYSNALNVFESIVSHRHEIIGVNVEFILNVANFYIFRLRKSIHPRYESSVTLQELEGYSTYILERNEMVFTELDGHEDNVERIKEVLFSHFSMAELMKRQQRYVDAFRLMEHNYDLCRNALGEEGIFSQWIKKDSALLLMYMGNVNQAVNMLVEVRSNLSKFLDASNVYLLLTTTSLAFSLSHLGKHIKALQYYEEVYNYYRSALGELHEVTLNLNACICIELLLLGRVDKAIDFLKPVSAIEKQEYFQTLLSKSKRLVKLGKATDALYILTYVEGAFEESYGEESLETLGVMLEVGFAYLKVGLETSSQKGMGYLMEVYERLEEFYGSDNEMCARRMKLRIAETIIPGARDAPQF